MSLPIAMMSCLIHSDIDPPSRHQQLDYVDAAKSWFWHLRLTCLRIKLVISLLFQKYALIRRMCLLRLEIWMTNKIWRNLSLFEDKIFMFQEFYIIHEHIYQIVTRKFAQATTNIKQCRCCGVCQLLQWFNLENLLWLNVTSMCHVRFVSRKLLNPISEKTDFLIHLT